MSDSFPEGESVSGWRDLPASAKGGTLALGNFDGVHLGHRHLIRVAHAARPSLPLGVVTFEPHPRELFRPDDAPFRLTLATERRDALRKEGVVRIHQLAFDREFSTLTAEEFVSEVLHRGLGAEHLTCGPDFAFGHRRGGDVSYLRDAAERLGIGLTVVPPLADDAGRYSSTRIRRLLLDGYPDRAARDLGRPWAIRGEVEHGDQRGRTIGFPTANIALGRHLEPALGVYAVRVELPDRSFVSGVANVGRRPTVASGLVSRLEVHLLDWTGDLYGQELGVSLIAFIRPERKFADFPALREQIAIDAEEARRILDAAR